MLYVGLDSRDKSLRIKWSRTFCRHDHETCCYSSVSPYSGKLDQGAERNKVKNRDQSKANSIDFKDPPTAKNGCCV
jgi:hypothetical protein